jgi:hypothetical protein
LTLVIVGLTQSGPIERRRDRAESQHGGDLQQEPAASRR